MSKPSLDDVEKTMKNRASTAVNANLAGAMKDLKKQDDLQVMPEEIFNEVFKPYFTGEKTISENNHIISKWVEYSGNIKRGVNLTDVNGTIIGTVPGLVRETPANFVTNLNIDFTKFGSEYELLKGRSHDKAIAKVDAVVNSIIDSTNDIAPDMKAFKKIIDKGDDYQPTNNDEDYVIFD